MSMGFEGQAQSFWGVHLGGLFEGNQRETIHSGQLPNSDSGRIQPPSGSSLASLNQPERVGQDILQIRTLSQMLENARPCSRDRTHHQHLPAPESFSLAVDSKSGLRRFVPASTLTSAKPEPR